MRAKHTHGPWILKVISDTEASVFSRSHYIVHIDRGHATGKMCRSRTIQDARLIASAPEMLEALRYIEGVAMADEPRDLPGIVKTARAAIAKATAKTTNTDAVTLRAENNAYAWRNSVHCADMTMTSKVFVNELTDAGRSLPPGKYRLMAVRQN